MPIFVLFEMNLNVRLNTFSLLAELRCCPSYVKQSSNGVWRGKGCLISRPSTGAAGIKYAGSNLMLMEHGLLSSMSSVQGTHAEYTLF